MHLDLTGEETSETIENDRYLLSPRVQTLRGIIAKFGPMAPPHRRRSNHQHHRSVILDAGRGRRSADVSDQPSILFFDALMCCALTAVWPRVASAREPRSREVTREFQREHPCPSTGKTSGACPGYRKDHIVRLAYGGPDAVSNLQWQTVADARAKDTRERRVCAR